MDFPESLTIGEKLMKAQQELKEKKEKDGDRVNPVSTKRAYRKTGNYSKKVKTHVTLRGIATSGKPGGMIRDPELLSTEIILDRKQSEAAFAIAYPNADKTLIAIALMGDYRVSLKVSKK